MGLRKLSGGQDLATPFLQRYSEYPAKQNGIAQEGQGDCHRGNRKQGVVEPPGSQEAANDTGCGCHHGDRSYAKKDGNPVSHIQ